MRGEVLNATECEFDNKLTRLDKRVIKSNETTTTNAILENHAIGAGPRRQRSCQSIFNPPHKRYQHGVLFRVEQIGDATHGRKN